MNRKFENLEALDDFLKTKEGEDMIQEFEAILSYPVLKNPKVQSFQMLSDGQLTSKRTFEQPTPLKDILQNDNIRDLDLPHIPLRDTLVHPEFTIPGLTWKGTQHYDDQLRKQVYFHYDYAMLRGPSHPDMDLLLARRSKEWRRKLMQQGVMKFEGIFAPNP